MPYRVRYHSRARQELDDSCAIYLQGFCGEVHGWIDEIASSAERDDAYSLDIERALDDPDGECFSQWKHTLETWAESGLQEKIASLLFVMRHRRPPWQIRMRSKLFEVIGAFNCELQAYYHLDHIAREVIFIKFDGLPGQ